MKSGILFPLSSFPSKHGIGDLGKEAYKVIDQLAANKGQYLQILPFHPSTQANSPYRAVSTYAGDEIYINLNSLVENELLDEVPEYYSETSENLSINIYYWHITILRAMISTIVF